MKKISLIQDEISGLIFPDMASYTSYHDRENRHKPSSFRQVYMDVAEDSDALKAFFDGFGERFAALQKISGWKKLKGNALKDAILHDLEYIYMGFRSGETGFTENAFYRFLAHYIIYMSRRKNGTDRE